MADTLFSDEDVHVHPELAGLVDDAVPEAGMKAEEEPQSLPRAPGLARYGDTRRPAREVAERAGYENGERHQAPATAALTHVIGGSPSARSSHESPSFREPKSFPLFVPK